MFKKANVTRGWLWPGTVSASGTNAQLDAYPDTNPGYYVVQQSTIVYGVTANLTTAPGNNCSTFVYLFKNDVKTPFVLGYGTTENSFKTSFNSTITLGPVDKLSVYISSFGTAANNLSHDMSFQVDLY